MKVRELFEGKYETDFLKQALKQIPDNWQKSKFFATGDLSKTVGSGKNPYVMMSFTKILVDLKIRPADASNSKYFLYDYGTFVRDVPAIEKVTAVSLEEYAANAESTYDALINLSKVFKDCSKHTLKFLDKREKFKSYKLIQSAYNELKLPTVTISPGPKCIKLFEPMIFRLDPQDDLESSLMAIDGNGRDHYISGNGAIWDLLYAASKSWFSLLDDIRFEISYNAMPTLTELEHLGLTSIEGLPERIDTDLNLLDNKIRDLHNLPKIIKGSLNLAYNDLESLQGISQVKEMSGTLNVTGNNIKSHILGVVMIKGCQGLEGLKNKKASAIINKYLPNTRGNDAVLECQNELIDAGLEEYAQL